MLFPCLIDSRNKSRKLIRRLVPMPIQRARNPSSRAYASIGHTRNASAPHSVYRPHAFQNIVSSGASLVAFSYASSTAEAGSPSHCLARPSSGHAQACLRRGASIHNRRSRSNRAS